MTRVKYLNHEIYYDELVSSLHLPQDQFKLNILNDLIIINEVFFFGESLLLRLGILVALEHFLRFTNNVSLGTRAPDITW